MGFDRASIALHTVEWSSIQRPVELTACWSLSCIANSLSATYQTSDPTSFAHISARERWPTILVDIASPRYVHFGAQVNQTGVIDDVHRSIAEIDASNDKKIKEGKSIDEQLAKLKYELQHNRQIS